jgi:hypothetical protein
VAVNCTVVLPLGGLALAGLTLMVFNWRGVLPPQDKTIAAAITSGKIFGKSEQDEEA